MRERVPIETLKAEGSTNLNRSLKREAAEAQNAVTPLAPEREDEVRKIDGLIAQALEDCKQGPTLGNRPNPAFAQLRLLVMTRERLLKAPRVKAPRSGEQLLAAANELLKQAGIN